MKTNTTKRFEVSGEYAIIKFIQARKGMIVEVISALYILLFLYTALSKSFDISSTEKVLKRTPGFADFAIIGAWSVVVVEYLIAVLLFYAKTRKIGLFASMILMTVFTGYIAYMNAFVPNLPCSCGGVISKMTWNEHLVFNIIFIILAFWGLLLMRNRNNVNSVDGTPL